MTQRVFKANKTKVTVYLDGPEWEGEAAATLGNFACKDEQDGAEVLGQAFSHIRKSGLNRVIGPMDGDTWHSYRLVTQTDESPAFLMEPSDQPLALKVFRAAGFFQISRYFSARVALDAAAQNIPEATDDFVIETWDGSDPEGLFGQVFDLSCEAFSKNAFYKPITRDAFLAMYMPMVPMLKRELIFFARRPDKTMAGFLFGTPNYGEGPQPTSAILKTYASLSKGAGQHLAYAFHKAALSAGYRTAIHALIHDDNQSAQRSAAEGADIFRRYGLFGLRLDDEPS